MVYCSPANALRKTGESASRGAQQGINCCSTLARVPVAPRSTASPEVCIARERRLSRSRACWLRVVRGTTRVGRRRCHVWRWWPAPGRHHNRPARPSSPEAIYGFIGTQHADTFHVLHADICKPLDAAGQHRAIHHNDGLMFRRDSVDAESMRAHMASEKFQQILVCGCRHDSPVQDHGVRRTQALSLGLAHTGKGHCRRGEHRRQSWAGPPRFSRHTSLADLDRVAFGRPPAQVAGARPVQHLLLA